jgi:pimeloyl-ACP methyl ester carboxylesterase
VWLLKAIGYSVLAALVCGYLTFCLLFYQGQWQLILHPTRATSSPPSIAGIPYEIIHFGPDESAVPQLTGWWVPADSTGRYAHFTILFLSGANGSLTDSVPTLAALHNIGVSIFAFDYRGYGQSAATRPNQQNMIHDADSAWQYLTGSRSISARQIIPYGFNVGASLAAHLAVAHPAAPALILDSPYADLLDAARRDPRSHLLPVSLLFKQRFPLAEPLSTLHTPKLLLSRSPAPDEAFQTAADPKVAVKLISPSEAAYDQSVSQFLDQYLHPGDTPQLVPSPAPVH